MSIGLVNILYGSNEVKSQPDYALYVLIICNVILVISPHANLEMLTLCMDMYRLQRYM